MICTTGRLAKRLSGGSAQEDSRRGDAENIVRANDLSQKLGRGEIDVASDVALCPISRFNDDAMFQSKCSPKLGRQPSTTSPWMPDLHR